MALTPHDPATQGEPGQDPLRHWTAIPLAISLGLAAGYLDVLLIVLRKYAWNEVGIFAIGSDFPWSVPLGHAGLLTITAVSLAVVSRLWPRPISPLATSWLLATLAIWSALLRIPLYALASLLLAAGLGRLIRVVVASLCRRPRRVLYTFAVMLGLLPLMAASSVLLKAPRNDRVPAALPANARNVLMIVWDTVRADHLSPYGYPRDTTPNLARWAQKGVRFGLALAAAPWTYPSHSCFFTGHWPFQLKLEWNHSIDARVPTLAEYLASRGYETAGFSANTVFCSYETGLDRGFSRFEDYPLTPRSFLGRTVAGDWILRNILSRNDYYESKWIRFRSRDAAAINDAFLEWLGHRRQDRPFFAFLNQFDAHEPYVAPPGYAGRFGIRPQSPRDYQFLLNYGEARPNDMPVRDLRMARDGYDDCIAFLDDQLGRLLDELKGRGILDNTLVIVTSDHGEAFGDHGSFLHPTDLYLDQIGVPLVILDPDAPAGRVVAEPVSLRDLPATVVDCVKLAAGSPFPGRSLATSWSSTPIGAPPVIPPAFSEFSTADSFGPKDKRAPGRDGLQMSLVALGRHYLRDGSGAEQLYDLSRDRGERVNLMLTPQGKHDAPTFRRLLVDVLSSDPGSNAPGKAGRRSHE
jgi:arylsulfatase A-like enzyme